MPIEWWGFNRPPAMVWLPERPEGYLLLALYGGALGYLLLRGWRGLAPATRGKRGAGLRVEWDMLLLLAACGFLLGNVFEWQAQTAHLPFIPGLPRDTPAADAPLLMLAPVIIAAGWLGPLAAGVVGFAAGLSGALWGTYHFSYAFETLYFGLLMSFFLRQSYRGRLAYILRNPFVATLFAAVPYAGLQLLALYGNTPASTVPTNYLVILDYIVAVALASLPGFLGQVVLSALVAGAFFRILPRCLPQRTGTDTWPFERTLNRQLFFAFVPMILLLTVGLVTAQMMQAVKVASQVAVSQMAAAADHAAQGLPLFMSSGRSLLVSFAGDARLREAVHDPVAAQTLLDSQQRTGAFFHALILFDTKRQPLAAFPPLLSGERVTTKEELYALSVVTLTNAVQETPVHAGLAGPNTLSFVTPLIDPETGLPVALLLGRTTLSDNPLMTDITNGLQDTLDAGSGFLVDEDGHIVVHPDEKRVMQVWTLDTRTTPQLPAPGQGTAYQGVAPDGQRELLYVQHVEGTNWSVVVSVPYEVVLTLAADIATPTLYLLGIASILGTLSITYVARRATRPLQTLSEAAGYITGGDLDSPVTVGGEDEVGQLGAAFERMRLGLKGRIEEMGLLLEVTQNVAATLDLERGLPPVLTGALRATNAQGVRVVLAPNAEHGATSTFAAGALGEALAVLDEPVWSALLRGEGVQIERWTAETRTPFALPPALAGRVQALLALPLRTQERLDGVLYLGYAEPHGFSETESAFLHTLAGEAAVLLDNARLFETAEGGRRRLAAILASTSDPVIVTERGDRLLLMNPAAEAVFDLRNAQVVGQTVRVAVSDPELVQLLTGNAPNSARELKRPDGRTFYASVSPIVAADGQTLGRVAVMRDITTLKALDEMKSDFVATVSHDLRGPLSAMRGFAAMLTVVGELNPKQGEYADKMVTSIDHMAQLIEDLLDLGRIEAGVGLVRETCDLQDFLLEIVEDARARAVAKGLTLEFSPGQRLPMFYGDSTLLRQAFVNLVDNAIKYTPAGGRVLVRIYFSKEAGVAPEIIVSVQDSGIGIAPADQVRLFEKFFRVKRRDTLAIKGTGLGLAIVKSIAERHGGRAWVQSQLGEGSTFSIALPLDTK